MLSASDRDQYLILFTNPLPSVGYKYDALSFHTIDIQWQLKYLTPLCLYYPMSSILDTCISSQILIISSDRLAWSLARICIEIIVNRILIKEICRLVEVNGYLDSFPND